MPNVTVTVNSDVLMGLETPAFARGNTVGANSREVLQLIIELLQGVAAGTKPSQGVHISWADTAALGDDATAGPSIAALALSGGSGSVGGTIAGTLVTATFATSDTNTAGLVAAAVNANTTVNRIVNATNVVADVSLTSVAAGASVRIGGITFTAVATAAEVVRFGQFNINGTDAQDAAALALAVNRHPALCGRFRAVSTAANLVLIAPLDRLRPITAFDTVDGLGAGFTSARPRPAAGAQTVLLVNRCGPEGNEVRLTASGTGMTAVTNGGAGFFGGGTGGGRAASRMVVLP